MTKTAVTLLLLGCSISPCQTPAKDPDTLQTLLARVHLLRQDLETVTIASQRAQIALYSLQMQDTAVALSPRKADEARNKCAGLAQDRDYMAAEVRNTEKGLEQKLAMLKGDVESLTAVIQRCQATEADAASRLRAEQAKLTELQERINQLDKTLEKLGIDRK